MICFASVTRVFVALLATLTFAGMSLADPLAAGDPAQNRGRATVRAKVVDDSGAALPGVTVTLKRAEETAAAETILVTDMNGGFAFSDVRPGKYLLNAALDGFQPLSREIVLVTNQALELALKLVPAFSESVEVVASAATTGEVAILESRRQSAVVSDQISAEEIRKSPDSTAAGIVERLTGVTLLGDKYVFVRGLGERYSGTTINGSTLPTTETEKRVVPLDLFPAKLIDSVNVVKTYTPDKAGDFGSGVVEMTTTNFPSAASMRLSVGTGWVSGTTGEGFRRYAGGLGRLGAGGQPMPAAIPSGFLKRRSVFDPNGYTPQELEAFGEEFVGAWTATEDSTAPAATDFSLTYGNSFGPLGVVLSGTSTHGFDIVDEEQRFFGFGDNGTLVPWNDYDLTLHRETAAAGGVGNFSLRLTDANRVYLNTVVTRDTSSEDRFQEGLQTNSGGDIRDYRVRYQKEQMLSTRLRGEHNLAGPWLGSLVDWSVARSGATNDSDLRENIYRMGGSGRFELQTGLAESGKTEYFALEDEIEQEGLSYTTFFAPPSGLWSGSVKGGVDRLHRTRDFNARRFRFVASSSLNVDLSKSPDEIFTRETIGPNGFELREITGVNDAYDADHLIEAAFVMGDVTRGPWRVIAGARHESSDQRVTTFNPFDTAAEVESANVNEDLLPSLNVVYQTSPRTNLRFGYGRSVNRPEFRELSPFTFVEVAGGRSVSGNPELQQATLDSYDLRWETFPQGGEVVAASVFYKKIEKPIERTVQPTTDFRTSFVNAEAATLWGIELEFRRSLARLAPSLENWSVNMNGSYINSSVTVGEQQYSVLTSTERPLEGQSDQVGNVSIQYYRATSETMVRALGSYSGERLTEVGAFGLPDIYEGAFTSVDIVVSQGLDRFVRGVELKLAGTNLLNARREFLQGGYIQRSFEPGRKVSLSLSYTPF